jgi:hypothetical protein
MSDYRPQGKVAPNQRLGHQSYSVNFKGVILWVVGFVSVAVVIHVGLGFVMNEFSRLNRQEKSRRPAILREGRDQFPPPNLQVNPAADMARFRREEQERLNTYGWSDRRNRIAHIPIERAMRLVVEEGLPTRKSAENATTTRTTEKP